MGVVALASAVVLLTMTPTAGASHGTAQHWATRTATVVDRTGSPSWNAATQYAVAVWNATNSGLRLSWAAGTGSCTYGAGRIDVCVGYANGYDGWTYMYWDGSSHLTGATVTMDTRVGADQGYRNALACHEVGHALRLQHSWDGSCMDPAIIADAPGSHDAESLRAMYAHTHDGTSTTSTTVKRRGRK